ncbi:MAG: hypothetical protein RL325_1186 [Planctomycetota bacterium]
MKLKTYQAWTMGEALDFVKSDLGSDAVILHTRTFERGGFFGLGRRTVVEITAARSQDIPAKAPRPEVRSAREAAPVSAARTGSDALRAAAAARAYGSAPRTGGESAPASGAANQDAPLNMDLERERTRRWAQAMAIALERSAVERASAGVNEHAVREAAVQKMAADNRAESREPGREPGREPVREDGPARRFAIVPEPGQQQGTGRLTAAVVKAQPETTPAPSISPTHSSAESARSVVEPKPEVAGDELNEISDFIGKVLKRSVGADGVSVSASIATAAAPRISTAAPARPPAFDAVHAELLAQDLEPELASRLVSDAARQLESAAAPSIESVRSAVLEGLVAAMPADRPDPFEMLPGRHGPRRIAFVGPTGVGKTTTLAKIAAQLKLKRGLRVGIVAADTYRIAAVDQLKTYAEILGLPVEIAASPRDAARACESLSDVDVILIDTAGRSQNDHMKLSELKAFLASAEPDETHLVLSATAGPRALARGAEAFGAAGIDRIVLTKLDEAATFGPLVSLVARLGRSVSFFTHGQEVPDHIEFGRSRRLASLVLGSEVR